jgi:hypothetical protein
MSKDIKILVITLLSSLLVVIGFAVLFGNKEVSGTLGFVDGVDVNPVSYELGSVPIDKGIITREYSVINTTDQTMKLKKITTSCMCTQAKVKIGERETRFFGMEGHGVIIPSVNLEIEPGQEVLVSVNFDPAAHGKEGIGLFDRVVWLTFSDPVGIKELKFSGEVVAGS